MEKQFHSINRIFYKVLNKEMNHNGFQYKIGLNIDIKEFKPKGSCEEGGLYYTTKEHLHKFYKYGIYVAEIQIPDDAKTYADPSGDKWKSDRLIIKNIVSIPDHIMFNIEHYKYEEDHIDTKDIENYKEKLSKVFYSIANKDSDFICWTTNTINQKCKFEKSHRWYNRVTCYVFEFDKVSVDLIRNWKIYTDNITSCKMYFKEDLIYEGTSNIHVFPTIACLGNPIYFEIQTTSLDKSDIDVCFTYDFAFVSLSLLAQLKHDILGKETLHIKNYNKICLW